MAAKHPDVVDHHDDHAHQPGFVERWFFSTNHKDIGTLYLVFSFVMFIIGAAMSVVIRTDLAVPGLQHVSPEFFNQMTTMHALVMIFGGVMPAFVGLGNWMIPLQIGAPMMNRTKLKTRYSVPRSLWLVEKNHRSTKPCLWAWSSWWSTTSGCVAAMA